MTESVHVEQLVARPREVVWEAIATPDGIARWWAPGDLRAEVGHRFTMDMGPWGQRPCRVLLEHAGFDLSDPQRRFAHENMGRAWGTTVPPRLAAQLAASTTD